MQLYYHHYPNYKLGTPIVLWGFPGSNWGQGNLNVAIAAVDDALRVH